jgi:hypothetical protein
LEYQRAYKRNAVRAKVDESACIVLYLQETKMHHFDHSLVHKMTPKRFNKFTFAPAEGASGGIFVGWNDSIFDGTLLSISRFAITVKFTSIHNAEEWTLTTIYGPRHGLEQQDFVNWLNSLNVDDGSNWMFIGDFHFYQSLQDRNREGGNMQDIMVFNEIISNLGLQKIPLKGRSFTWSNMQQNPLLDQLD